MNPKDYEQLARVAGIYDGVLTLPLCRAMTHDQLTTAERWGHAATVQGLPCSDSRQAAVSLRLLAEDGFLEAGGATQGRAWKLTVKGWHAAAAMLGTSPEALRVFLNRVATLQAASDIHMDGHPERPLCMAWHLLPEAGPWLSKASRSPAAWKAFQSASANLEGLIVPLLALGWVYRYVATSQTFWALAVTAAGRAALADWPTADLPDGLPTADNAGIVEAWGAGVERGKGLCQTAPPEATKNVLAERLPASAWM